MSDTANSFGGQAYTSQTTKALTSITESPGPDLSDGEQQFVSMLSRHDYQIKFLADNQQTLQVGVNQATSNPIQQVQQFVADIQVLLSGASLPKGALDFGDLQYILPAIGALFGFGTGEYPVNLFTAAEKFFFGYVVPTQQYTDLQIAGFNSYASQLGIDPKFIKDMDSLTQAFGDLFNGLQNIGPSLASLFDALGISGTDLGPLGQLLAPILKWFQPIDFSKFGSMIEWLTDAIDPWVVSITKVVNFINALLAAFGAGGDVVNSPLPDVTRPFSNLIKLFATLDLTDPQFKTLQGWEQMFTSIFVNLTEFDQGVWAALGGATEIPISAITDSQPNLLYNADFEGAISVAASDDWSWDPTTYYSADAVPGSAKLTADGHGHGLRSNPIRLRTGQKLNLRVRVLTSGLVATGTPLTLDVVLFLNGTQVAVQNIASTGAPTGAASDWFSAPSGSKDGLLQGVFTMPETADSVRVRLGVAASATAGDVWFDDTLAVLTGGLITNLLDDFNAGSVAFTQLWTSLTTAALSYTTWPAFAAAFNTAVQTYVTTMSGLEADEVVTIEQLLNSLIPGLFPTGSSQPTGLTLFFDQITAFLQAVFGGNSFAGALASFAAPAVANTVHTPQVVPNFPNAASIASGATGWAAGGWSWDSGMSWEGSAGSAKVDADGSVKAMSGVLAPVQPGQTVAVGQTSEDGSAITTAPVVQWAALAAASGVPIQFQLIPYSGAPGSWVAGTPFAVAQSVSRAPNQSSWMPLTLVTDSANHVAAGIYTVPSSGVTAVQVRLAVDSVAASGSVWWNNCQLVIAGGYLPSIAAGFTRLNDDAEASNLANQTALQGVLTAITDYSGPVTFWATINTVYQTWVTTQSGLEADEVATIDQMIKAAFNIDPTTGLTNQNQIAGLSDQFDQIGAALSGDTSSSGDWTWLANIMVNWFGLSTVAHSTSTDNANILKIVDNRPLVYGLDSTTEAGGIPFTAATTPLTITPGTELIAFARCSQNDTKNTAAFTAEQAGSTTPDGLFVNIYKVDFTNSKLAYITTTTFATAVLGLTTESFLFADMMGTPVVPGDVIGIGFQSQDPVNTMNVYGGALTKPVHPAAQLPAYAATRSGAGTTHPTADIPLSDLTFSNTAIPYIGLETSAPPPPTYPDFPTTITTPGTTTFMPDPWALHLDLIGLGAGGSGEGELGFATGYGGTGGTWGATTLTVGVDIEPGTPITVSVAPQNLYPGGGPGGTTPYGDVGLDGLPTTFTWTKPDTTTGTLTCAGGFGGNHGLGLSHNTLSFGLGPGDETWNGETYVGGAERISAGPGYFPGGGGWGAQPFEYGQPGAAGVAVIVERQT